MTEYKDLIDAEKEAKEHAISDIDCIFEACVERTSDIPFKYRIKKEAYERFKRFEKEISEHVSNYGYTFSLIIEKEKQNAKFFVIDRDPNYKKGK